MSEDYRSITYTDELQTDNSVRREYSTGRHEWRRQLPDGTVEWQDTDGNAGVDELLGDGVIKRTFSTGQVVYGREHGYGRTAWRGPSGEIFVTMNQSSFGGKVGAVLAGVGAGVLLGSLVPPPDYLSPEEEELLRQKQQQQPQRDSGDSGTDYDHDDDFDSDDSGFYSGDSDFG
jgi:hypothetical protein